MHSSVPKTSRPVPPIHNFPGPPQPREPSVRTRRNPVRSNWLQPRVNPRFRNKSARTNAAIIKRVSPIVPNGPISPAEAIRDYGSLLTPYELEEIKAFPEIYFVGQRSSKITYDPSSEKNYGFDTADENYQLVSGDHLAYRFQILSLFGAGAFGQVARCFDHKTKTEVAVKIVVNTEQMHEQGRIEAQILSRINNTDTRGVVEAREFFIFREHICITFEILGQNLFELAEMNNFKPFSVRLVKLYAIQLLTALDCIHKLGIVHCDLKPENVLLVPGSNSLVKLIDFGSSCFVGYQMYEYIQSRFYRAPEVLLGIPYGPPMDIWSFALIIIELLHGSPLFPGETESEQIAMIMELIGPPPKELVEQGKRKTEFFDSEGELANKELLSNRKPGSLKLAAILNKADQNMIDFLMRCLTWDQNERITAAEALKHPWIRTKEIRAQSKKSSSYLPGL